MTETTTADALQVLWDNEQRAHWARRLVAARGEEAGCLALERAARQRMLDARRATLAGRSALSDLVDELRETLPPADELAGWLGRVRAAREQELALEKAETDARLAYLARRKKVSIAHGKVADLVDALSAGPTLFDFAARESRAANGAPAPNPMTSPERGHAEAARRRELHPEEAPPDEGLAPHPADLPAPAPQPRRQRARKKPPAPAIPCVEPSP